MSIYSDLSIFQNLQSPSGFGGLSQAAQPLLSLIQSGASLFEENARLISTSFAADSGLAPGQLIAHKLTGTEAVNEGLRYELEMLSVDVSTPTEQLVGVPIQVSILTDSGGERDIAGIVTEAHQEGSDGGFASLWLVIEDGLSVLRLRTT